MAHVLSLKLKDGAFFIKTKGRALHKHDMTQDTTTIESELYGHTGQSINPLTYSTSLATESCSVEPFLGQWQRTYGI